MCKITKCGRKKSAWGVNAVETGVYRGCEVGGVDVFPLLNTHG